MEESSVSSGCYGLSPQLVEVGSHGRGEVEC